MLGLIKLWLRRCCLFGDDRTRKRAGICGALMCAALTSCSVKAASQRGSLTMSLRSWRLPATNNQKACAGSDTFKLKHTISHGG